MPGLASYGFPTLEGDYSTWTAKWKQAYAAGEGDYSHPIRFDESLDKIFIANQYWHTFAERKLSDGSGPSVLDTINVTLGPGESEMNSILRKYFAYVVNEGGVPKLKIYKDGSLIQTIDLSVAPVSWTSISAIYYVDISPDGKYILINNTFDDEYALFQGS